MDAKVTVVRCARFQRFPEPAREENAKQGRKAAQTAEVVC
jgi:hypothetical protein